MMGGKKVFVKGGKMLKVKVFGALAHLGVLVLIGIVETHTDVGIIVGLSTGAVKLKGIQIVKNKFK
jgi:hypothetical protein